MCKCSATPKAFLAFLSLIFWVSRRNFLNVYQNKSFWFSVAVVLLVLLLLFDLHLPMCITTVLFAIDKFVRSEHIEWLRTITVNVLGKIYYLFIFILQRSEHVYFVPKIVDMFPLSTPYAKYIDTCFPLLFFSNLTLYCLLTGCGRWPHFHRRMDI